MENSIRCPHCGNNHSKDTTHCPVKGLPIYRSSRKTKPDEKTDLKTWIIGGVIAGLILAVVSFLFFFVLLPAISNPKPVVVEPPYIVPTLTLPPFQTRVAVNTPDQAAAPTADPNAQPQPEKTPENAVSEAPWQACENNPFLSQVRVGDTAQVALDPPLPNRVRQESNTTATIVGYIDPGEQVTIIDGPSCSQGWVWWKVEGKSGTLIGWTAEGNQDAYWLVPVP